MNSIEQFKTLKQKTSINHMFSILGIQLNKNEYNFVEFIINKNISNIKYMQNTRINDLIAVISIWYAIVNNKNILIRTDNIDTVTIIKKYYYKIEKYLNASLNNKTTTWKMSFQDDINNQLGSIAIFNTTDTTDIMDIMDIEVLIAFEADYIQQINHPFEKNILLAKYPSLDIYSYKDNYKIFGVKIPFIHKLCYDFNMFYKMFKKHGFVLYQKE